MGAFDADISLNELEQGQNRPTHDDEHAIPDVYPSEYLEKHVNPHRRSRPWLDILREFLEPIEKTEQGDRRFSIPPRRRLLGLDVQVAHVSASGGVTVNKCNSANEFKDQINSQDDARIGTIVIAEDLTREMIDVLGMHYDLEPEFMACHLQGTEMFRTGYWESPMVRDPVRAPNILPGGRRRAPYYSVEFRRPYHLPGGLQELFDLRGKVSNTPRGAQTLGLGSTLPELFIFEKISVYKRKGANFAIILTDKLLSERPSASYMLDIVTSHDDDAETLADLDRRKQISCRKELVGWLKQLGTQEAKQLFDDQEPLALRPVLQIVERASSTFLAHARFIMSRIVTNHCDDKFPDSIGFLIQVSRSLHWEIHDQQRVLKLAMRVASLRGGKRHKEQLQNLRYLIEDMGDSLKSLDEDVRFLVAAANIREGRVVGWVSKFAFVFLPVSLLAAILAIDGSTYIRYTILGALGVPFLMISAYLMFFWKASQTDSLRDALTR